MAPAAARCRGFTLLELLVVLVILSVMAATAVLSFGTLGRDDELQREAARLTALLRLAGEEALLNGQDLGLYLEQDGYRFMAYSPESGQWVGVANATFHSRRLPEDLGFSLTIEDRPVELRLLPEEEDETRQPHIGIYSSGELTPFELGLSRQLGDEGWLIEGEIDGELSLTDLGRDEA